MLPLPLSYWPWLAGMIVCYMLQTQLVKVFYMKKFKGEWHSQLILIACLVLTAVVLKVLVR